MSQPRVSANLTAADYAVFGITLGISAVIGIFFAIKARKSRDGLEGYMMGGRSLGMIPVALSLTVTFLSAIAVLGIPSEIYNFGTMYAWFPVSAFITSVITSETFLPIFYRLRLSSTFEYLERRFSRAVRLFATICYLVWIILYLGIVIYAPSLALNAVTGFSLWGSILSTGIVCIFYTTLGGIKAVVWTDVFQAIVMLMGFLAIIIEGSIQLGGYGEVWRICFENGRIDFLNFETDPRIRHTFWTIVVGGIFLYLNTIGISQGQVQRYLSCKNEAQAKGSLFFYWFGATVINYLCVIAGTIMYAYFHGCDPLLSGEVGATDQIFPYLTLQLLSKYPGLPGLVVSCIFSGSLSTVSTGINSLSLVTVVDVIKPFTNLSENKYTWISKGLVVVYGGLAVAMAYLISELGGSILQLSFSLSGIFGGPNVALYVLGILFPFVNSYGAFFGYAAGLASTIWLYIGKSIYPTGIEFTRKLPVSTAQCIVAGNSSTFGDATTIFSTQPPTDVPPIADFYHISYVYYSCVGVAAAVIAGLIVSLITRGWSHRKQVDPALLHFFFDHWMFKWLPKKFRDFMRCGLEPYDFIKNEKEQKIEFETSLARSSESLSTKDDLKMHYENHSFSNAKESVDNVLSKSGKLTAL